MSQEQPMVTGQRTIDNRCECVCGANHPEQPDICVHVSRIKVFSAGGAEINMCRPCADEWDRQQQRGA